MRLMAPFRRAAFFVYVFVGLATPPALLAGLPGLALGSLAALSVLGLMRWRGLSKIDQALQVKPLGLAQAPAEYAILTHYCRRLGLSVPALGIIESPSLDIAVYGFGPKNKVIVTRGLLVNLSRPELTAVIARVVCRLWARQVDNETWLARFLEFVQFAVFFPTEESRLSPALLLRQVFIYPLTLLPAYLLRARGRQSKLDHLTARLAQNPRGLAEALRKMDAMNERMPHLIPFSCRHLFLTTPPARDPMARLFFSREGLGHRARAIEALSQAANPS